MTQAQQPEALRLAEQCDNFANLTAIATCLRAQHDRIRELEGSVTHLDNVYSAAMRKVVELEQGKCLHQIAEPAAQGLNAPMLDDAWKARLLDGAPMERDKYGCGYHPALPTFDEGVNGAHFFAVFGIQLKAGMAESEMDSDAYEAMTINGLTEDGPNYNAWTPEKPDGDDWCLVAVFDTEDGPACWWVRAAQTKQGGPDHDAH